MGKKKQKLHSPDGLSGPSNKWEKVGDSVYRKKDSYIWKDEGGWFRTDLTCPTFRMCLSSICVSPIGGLFSHGEGPFKTLGEAKKPRRRR